MPSSGSRHRNELVEDMREIDNIGEALKDLKIPVELLQ